MCRLQELYREVGGCSNIAAENAGHSNIDEKSCILVGLVTSVEPLAIGMGKWRDVLEMRRRDVGKSLDYQEGIRLSPSYEELDTGEEISWR